MPTESSVIRSSLKEITHEGKTYLCNIVTSNESGNDQMLFLSSVRRTTAWSTDQTNNLLLPCTKRIINVTTLFQVNLILSPT